MWVHIFIAQQAAVFMHTAGHAAPNLGASSEWCAVCGVVLWMLCCGVVLCSAVCGAVLCCAVCGAACECKRQTALTTNSSRVLASYYSYVSAVTRGFIVGGLIIATPCASIALDVNYTRRVSVADAHTGGGAMASHAC